MESFTRQVLRHFVLLFKILTMSGLIQTIKSLMNLEWPNDGVKIMRLKGEPLRMGLQKRTVKYGVKKEDLKFLCAIIAKSHDWNCISNGIILNYRATFQTIYFSHNLVTSICCILILFFCMEQLNKVLKQTADIYLQNRYHEDSY